jgi:hypothetical protein
VSAGLLRQGGTRAAAALAFALGAATAHAGPYSDDLAKCLVESTTSADKNALVRWMFATAALHPAVKSIASVTEAERTQSNRAIARLFENLVAETCRAQTQQAVKYEGAAALQTGFQILGQVAARELFSDPSVTKGMADLERHFDAQKLQRALNPAP